MKKTLVCFMISAGMGGPVLAQSLTTGPNSSQSPNLYASVPGASLVSIMTAGDSVGHYKYCGIGDGMGAFDNGNGSITLVMNHEIGNTLGAVRAHGSIGSFISKWTISKTDFSVTSGSDLMQNVYLWNGTSYTMYNATNPSTLAAFGRFCSADLPPVNAFYNENTGKGTTNRIFMNGEENGSEGRAMAHIVTGPAGGNSYELPHLGKLSIENSVARPFSSDKTVVSLLDDSSPGQLYIYVGNKSTTGTDIEKAGLFGGRLYGISVSGMPAETNTLVAAANTPFTLIDMGGVSNITGSTLNSNSNNAGVTTFLRPEDGTWDDTNPTDFYFVTTNAFTSPSRMYRLRFYDLEHPEYGGTISCLLDGTEGQKMLDNMDIDGFGHILLQEDPGGNAYLAKVWQYDIAGDALTEIMVHDSTRFKVAGPGFLTIDEESSGIINAQDILGAGWFLFNDQVHMNKPLPMVENGQLLAYYNPASAQANPEINVKGNNVDIVKGAATPLVIDNTDFGVINTGVPVIRHFVVQNAGPGTLWVKGITIKGANASSFKIISGAGSTSLAANSSYTFGMQYLTGGVGTHTAQIAVINNDANENIYDFAVRGTGAVPEITIEGNNTFIPDNDNVTSPIDNTDFGTVLYNNTIGKTFTIRNEGNGTLTVNNIVVAGPHAGQFTLSSAPDLPTQLAGSGSVTFGVIYHASAPGVHFAEIDVQNSDADESFYNFSIMAESTLDVGIRESSVAKGEMVIYPNPANDAVNIILESQTPGKAAICITDLDGRVLIGTENRDLKTGRNVLGLNVAFLPEGAYTVKLNSGDGVRTAKLLIAR